MGGDRVRGWFGAEGAAFEVGAGGTLDEIYGASDVAGLLVVLSACSRAGEKGILPSAERARIEGDVVAVD